MRHFVLSLALGLFLFLGFSASAQQVLDLTFENPTQTIDNKTYTLIDVNDWGDVTIKYTELDDQGRVFQEGQYVNGKHNGVWSMYSNGILISQLRFSMGQKVWCKLYKLDGYQMVYYENNKPHLIQTEQRLASN